MLRLEIVTPEKRVLDETVDTVTIPTQSGEIGILPEHAPLISALRAGILSYTKGGTTDKIVVSGGFVEVGANRVSVLADTAEYTDEIDVAAARAQLEQGERAIGTLSGEEFEVAREQIERAEARLQLTAGR